MVSHTAFVAKQVHIWYVLRPFQKSSVISAKAVPTGCPLQHPIMWLFDVNVKRKYFRNEEEHLGIVFVFYCWSLSLYGPFGLELIEDVYESRELGFSLLLFALPDGGWRSHLTWRSLQSSVLLHALDVKMQPCLQRAIVSCQSEPCTACHRHAHNICICSRNHWQCRPLGVVGLLNQWNLM